MSPPLSVRAGPAASASGALWSMVLDRGSTIPLARQLATALRQAIVEGKVGAGARLPSTRGLALELGVARSTVVSVFEQLAAEGYIAAKSGAGYFVPPPFTAAPHPVRDDIAPRAHRPLSRQGEILRSLPAPALPLPRPFELGRAEIDVRLVATWKHLASRALSGRSRLSWNYGDPRGEPELRRAIAEYLAVARGLRCDAEQIVLTSGTQQGLSLAIRILVNPGDTVVVKDPCYRSTVEILEAAEARIVPVAVDDDGLNIAAAPRHPAPRLVCTTPSRQYPLGMAMPLARRAALLAWAEAVGAWLVEDDYESEFQPPSRQLPALQGLDRAGRVIYLGTFSKLLFPSLRLGYAVLPPDLVDPFTGARHLADRQSSGLLQAIMTDFILGGHFARHLKRMRSFYAQRRASLAALLEQHLGGILKQGASEGGGMYMTAWLPPDWFDREVVAALAAADVAAVPLSALTIANPCPPGLLLGYTGHTETALARAVERMAAVFDRQIGRANFKKLELRPDQLAG
jgi:GntR family transcriptional regulator / MocR family aminotransferase